MKSPLIRLKRAWVRFRSEFEPFLARMGDEDLSVVRSMILKAAKKLGGGGSGGSGSGRDHGESRVARAAKATRDGKAPVRAYVPPEERAARQKQSEDAVRAIMKRKNGPSTAKGILLALRAQKFPFAKLGLTDTEQMVGLVLRRMKDTYYKGDKRNRHWYLRKS